MFVAIEKYCKDHKIPLTLIKIDSLGKAKAMPGVFNNWAVFYNGKFETVHLMNKTYLEKFLFSNTPD